MLAVLLSVWQAKSSPGACLPARIGQHIVVPLQVAITSGGGWVQDMGTAAFSMRAVVEENRRLEEERDRLKDEKLLLIQDALDGKTIREKLGFSSPPPPGLVPARVIGRSAGGSRRHVTIRAAGDRKLEVGNIVRDARGLVGRVLSADTGDVILLTDREHAVAGKIMRSGAEGMIYPATDVDAGPVCLRLEKLTSHADIREGDIVLTSGIGGVYPGGLPIGFVDSVQRAAGSGAAMTGCIRPFADFDSINYVYVARYGR